MNHTLERLQRMLLGFAVGASFGLFIGAIVASWVLGPEAGGAEIGRATVISIAAAVLLGVLGGYVGRRRPDDR